MSDDDRDNDLESDELTPIRRYSKRRRFARHHKKRLNIASNPSCLNRADKRAHHNALERKRRDHIKDSFSSLRDTLPCMAGEKASRAQVLKKAADYIHQMRKKNSAHQHDIEDLKRQNKILEEQMGLSSGAVSRRRKISRTKVRNLEKAKTTGNYTTNGVLDTSHYNTRGDAISAFDGGSGSESTDTDGSTKDGRRKKLKTSLIDPPLRA